MNASETHAIEFLVGELTGKLKSLLDEPKQPRDLITWIRRWTHRLEQFKAQLQVFQAREGNAGEDNAPSH